jgi:hypothetical protein
MAALMFWCLNSTAAAVCWLPRALRRGQPQAGLPQGGHPPFWSAGAATAVSRRCERTIESTLSVTIPIVNHQL